MDLLIILPGQDHLTHRTPFAYLLDGDRENICSMEKVIAYLRQKGPNKRWINVLVKDKSPAVRINHFQCSGANNGLLFNGNGHKSWRFIRSRLMRVVLFEPVMKLAVGNVLFFTKF